MSLLLSATVVHEVEMPDPGSERLLNQILEAPQLPSLPAVALDVIELVQRPDVSVGALAETIARDPALAGKLLKTVNSSFYAQARTITTIRQAVVIMGLNSVRTLALGFSLVDGLNRADHSGFDHGAFWQRSLRAAAGARAFSAKFAPQRAEEAFLGGLLGRLGVLAMVGGLGDRYHPVFAAADDDMRRLAELEQEAFGLSHTEVGARLADRWNLPLELGAAIGDLETPERSRADVQEFVRLVAIGDVLAGVFGNAAGPALARYRSYCAEWYDLYPEQGDQLVTEAADAASAMLALFELTSPEALSTAAILARANEALQRMSLEAAQETARLTAENRDLSLKASTDALTGLSTRRRFDESIAEQMAVVSRYRGTLSLLMVDLDHFKQVNDTYGHQAGDLVLAEVGRLLRLTMRDADLAARYGGEEFAVILPATDLPNAIEAAERMRTAVAGLDVHWEGDRIAVTASVGAAEAALGESPSDLITRADRALYAAKEAGRNRVVGLAAEQAA